MFESFSCISILLEIVDKGPPINYPCPSHTAMPIIWVGGSIKTHLQKYILKDFLQLVNELESTYVQEKVQKALCGHSAAVQMTWLLNIRME